MPLRTNRTWHSTENGDFCFEQGLEPQMQRNVMLNGAKWHGMTELQGGIRGPGVLAAARI